MSHSLFDLNMWAIKLGWQVFAAHLLHSYTINPQAAICLPCALSWPLARGARTSCLEWNLSAIQSHLQVFALNQRVQTQNRAPMDFPGFIKDGFDTVIVADGYTKDSTG
jgi:hypothetical protein